MTCPSVWASDNRANAICPWTDVLGSKPGQACWRAARRSHHRRDSRDHHRDSRHTRL